MQSMPYGFGQEISLSYQEALEKTKAALKDEGFGVLCEIDVRKVMKEKLNADFRPYIILGVCNPPLAHKALEAELDLGLLLPCNLIIYEMPNGKATIKAMETETMMQMVGNPQLEQIGREVKQKMQRVIAKVAGA